MFVQVTTTSLTISHPEFFDFCKNFNEEQTLPINIFSGDMFGRGQPQQLTLPLGACVVFVNKCG